MNQQKTNKNQKATKIDQLKTKIAYTALYGEIPQNILESIYEKIKGFLKLDNK